MFKNLYLWDTELGQWSKKQQQQKQHSYRNHKIPTPGA